MIERDSSKQHRNPITNYDQLLDSDQKYRTFLAKVDFITDSVAIGNRAQLEDPDVLKPYHFKSVLSVDNPTTQLPTDKAIEKYQHFPLIDGPGNDFRRFENAVFALKELVSEHPPVFVHCHAGRRRTCPAEALVTLRLIAVIRGRRRKNLFHLMTEHAKIRQIQERLYWGRF